MEAPRTTLSAPLVLTTSGRRRLEERLLQATAALRELADQTGGDQAAEHHRLQQQVEELEALLARAQAPTDVPDDPRIVEVGDEVLIEYDDGELERHVVVAPVEAALSEDRVSVASPLGRALVGRAVGDRVTVDAPAGAYTCTIRERQRAS
jgi:transcription elongation factor GreA